MGPDKMKMVTAGSGAIIKESAQRPKGQSRVQEAFIGASVGATRS